MYTCSTPEGIGGGISVTPVQGYENELLVLNARRHRRGNQGGRCDGAWNGASVLNARRHRRGNQTEQTQLLSACSSAQRPKASEGESGPRWRCRESTFPAVLNARRHRRGNQFRSHSPAIPSKCAQRPKASEGESGFPYGTSPGPNKVLNARRHRRGNQPLSRLPSEFRDACSTPEGIGGGIRNSLSGGTTLAPQCSTPEGIGGGIRCRFPRWSARRSEVLNARRHRRGNQGTPLALPTPAQWCSTPEGIGGGIRSCHKTGLRRSVSAQRPKASEGESEEDYEPFCHQFVCSTPEGIGGGISCKQRHDLARRRSVLNARRHRRGNQITAIDGLCSTQTCAQRPKASEGESASHCPGSPT